VVVEWALGSQSAHYNGSAGVSQMLAMSGGTRKMFSIMGDQMFPFPNRLEKLRQSLKRLLLRRKLADKNTFDGEPYTHESLNILRAAETQGYVLSVANNKTIAATKNHVTLFVRSNGDIQRFGQNRGFI
jgi:hypothetical protein